MINTLESLANEILLIILSNLTCGILIGETGPSLNKYQSILLPIISNSTLSASLQRTHIDGAKSIFFNLISKWIFQEKIIRFVNLKTFILTRCCLSEILINNLSLLVQNQLDELILTFDKDMFEKIETGIYVQTVYA
ncbi:unnamed protein product [Rotaria sp. Silwood1]|nr:unnamed protein product [Rotaria sp. Silwood1]CAF1583527.1 unnamed protein product [Rotaria sp. Silwood1]CAF1583652.1 unnamed protein product [Rotaria sp. Silwood1]CAF3671870.1 unnamed protein product [Rotaria sp. Silwood1]CAF3753842.1 unnamed protein product [Rotaria sp. Silwood1]